MLPSFGARRHSTETAPRTVATHGRVFWGRLENAKRTGCLERCTHVGPCNGTLLSGRGGRQLSVVLMAVQEARASGRHGGPAVSKYTHTGHKKNGTAGTEAREQRGRMAG